MNHKLISDNNNCFLFKQVLKEYNTVRRKTDEALYSGLAEAYYKKHFDKILLPIVENPESKTIPQLMSLLKIQTPITSLNELNQLKGFRMSTFSAKKFDYFVHNHVKCMQIITLGLVLEKNQQAISENNLCQLLSEFIDSLLYYEAGCVKDSIYIFMQGINDVFPQYKESIYNLLLDIQTKISYKADISNLLSIFK